MNSIQRTKINDVSDVEAHAAFALQTTVTYTIDATHCDIITE